MEMWDEMLGFLWRPENDGQPLHSTANDHGRTTAWGVSTPAWNRAVADGIAHGNLADAPKTLLASILKHYYWDVLACDQLPRPLALQTGNLAILSGEAEARTILGLARAQELGPIGQADVFWYLAKLHYTSLAQFDLFGRGWLRRNLDCWRLAVGNA